MAGEKGMIYNIQKYSLDDGPGIRTIVFMKGCPLRCKWCANPESQETFRQVGHRASTCVLCGKCYMACPKKCIALVPDDEQKVIIDHDVCDNCGACVDVCLHDAMRFYGREATVDEVWKEVKKDLHYYFDTHGGVTISGGEPMYQPDFVAALLKKCRSEGVHTAIETCGFVSPEALDKVLPFVDLFLFDIKHMDSAEHQKWTGGPNEPIQRNIETVVKAGKDITIRFPMIPGVNDSHEHLVKLAERMVELNGMAKKPIGIDIMPFHNFGENKYQNLGMPYFFAGMERPPQEKKDEVMEIMTSHGITCVVR